MIKYEKITHSFQELSHNKYTMIEGGDEQIEILYKFLIQSHLEHFE